MSAHEKLGGISNLSLPSFNPSLIVEYLPSLLWLLILIIVFVFIFKLATHRILVDFDDRVREGYVIKPGRYAKVFSRRKRIWMLKPMFGRDVLPDVPMEYMQKVEGGTPLIGAKRKVELIRVNPYNYFAVTPSVSQTPTMQYHDIDSMGWTFFYEREAYINRKLTMSKLQGLVLVVPILTILVLIGIFCIHAFVGWSLWGYYTTEIETMTQQIIQWVKP